MSVPRAIKLQRRRVVERETVGTHWQAEILGVAFFVGLALLAAYVIAAVCYALGSLSVWMMS